MARNSEKHFVGLNRMFLEEQWKKEKERKRPNLSELKSARDVRKWIPSIKKEINYCIEQLSGARQHDYTDVKLKEFENRLAYLEREYKRFVQRVLELDPTSKEIPWTSRPYKRKHKHMEFHDAKAEKRKETKEKKPVGIHISEELFACKESAYEKSEANVDATVQNLVSYDSSDSDET